MAVLTTAVSSQTNVKKTARNEGSKGGEIKIQEKIPPQSNRIEQQQVIQFNDHHTHIWSLNASTHVTAPLLPTVELPEDLSRLLREREKGWNDKAALADLYTEDVVMLRPSAEAHGWVNGRATVVERISRTFSRAYRIAPVSYQVNGSLGYLAGYFVRGDGNAAKPFGNILLSLKKSSDGKWRIAAETLSFPGPAIPGAVTAAQLIAEMDAAGVKRAAVLSVAFWFGNAARNVEDEYAKVRAENDWVAEQVTPYPTRLVGFCSFNPLKDYAIEELNRCSKNPSFKGLKLHVGNSGVDMLNPQHIEKLSTVFRAANEKRLPIIIHLWTSTGNYGRPHAEAFLNQVLGAAPNIPIQIAHMAATGPGYTNDDAFEVYANAAAQNDSRMKNVYVDVASAVIRNTPPETLQLVAKRLRQFGIQRVLFASDRSPGFGNESPKDAWESFRRLPLTEEEYRIIAGNAAPYLR
jgi:predicted TIM-barrel fold metal-dependent hydrolase